MVERIPVKDKVVGSNPTRGAKYSMFYIYILYSHKTKTIYVGQTNDIDKRLKEHRLGKVFSTKNKNPLSLIYSEEYSTRGEAMRRERFFKSLASSKLKRKIVEKFLADGSSKS